MYRNEKEPTKTTFTAKEAKAHDKITHMQTERDYLMTLIRNLDLRLAILRKDCKHEVFVDKPGFPYDLRYCCVCDSYLGMI